MQDEPTSNISHFAKIIKEGADMPRIDKQEARTMVGEWLKAHREATGLGRVRFARHCGTMGADFTDNVLKFWEAGRQMPDEGVLADLVAALEPDHETRVRILAARLYVTPDTLRSLLGC